MECDQPFDQIPAHQQAASTDRCPRCGMAAPLIYVHGHAQCSACGSNILDCCQGAACDLAAQR